MIAKVRGKGLLNAVVIRPKNGKEAWDVCLKILDMGLLETYSRRYYPFCSSFGYYRKRIVSRL